MKVAVAQMTSGIDPAANADFLVDAVKRAADGGAVMLFTPEMSGLLDRNRPRSAAHIVPERDDRVLAAVSEAAARHGIWVALGSLALARDDGRRANRTFVIDDRGAVRARYDKLHLFDVDLDTGESWRESSVYAPGEQAVVVDTPIGPLGLSICYDLRVPDLYRARSDAGATILAIPAAFTRPTGTAHWEVMLRARAIESSAFVIAAAQTGEHEDGRATWGHSMIVDPWGHIVAQASDYPGFTSAAVDRDYIATVRERIPVRDHRVF